MRTFTLSLVLLALTAAAGCGKNDSDSGKSGTNVVPAAQAASALPTPPKVEPAPSAPAAVVKQVQHVELEIASVANTMTFDKTTLTVPTGAEVHLVFKNNATMSTLPHNWVLVKTGTEASVAAAGLKMGEPAGYIDVRDHDMVANTGQAKPGESSSRSPSHGARPGRVLSVHLHDAGPLHDDEGECLARSPRDALPRRRAPMRSLAL